MGRILDRLSMRNLEALDFSGNLEIPSGFGDLRNLIGLHDLFPLILSTL